jgi:hypothetical protein
MSSRSQATLPPATTTVTRGACSTSTAPPAISSAWSSATTLRRTISKLSSHRPASVFEPHHGRYALSSRHWLTYCYEGSALAARYALETDFSRPAFAPGPPPPPAVTWRRRSDLADVSDPVIRARRAGSSAAAGSSPASSARTPCSSALSDCCRYRASTMHAVSTWRSASCCRLPSTLNASATCS